MCQVPVDAENLNSTFENFSGVLDWTFCQVWIWSVQAKFVFSSVDFLRGWKLKFVPSLSWCKI